MLETMRENILPSNCKNKIKKFKKNLKKEKKNMNE